MDKQKLLDSLTREQRIDIAQIIRSADIEGDYHTVGEGGESAWFEDTSETLDSLARVFETHDPESAI
jgi:hypothetical protein